MTKVKHRSKMITNDCLSQFIIHTTLLSIILILFTSSYPSFGYSFTISLPSSHLSRTVTIKRRMSKQRYKIDSHLWMMNNNNNNNNNNHNNNNENSNNDDKKKKKKHKNPKIKNYENYEGDNNLTNTTLTIQKRTKKSTNNKSKSNDLSSSDMIDIDIDVDALKKRLTQLECLVSSQSVELRKLRQECQDLNAAAASFAHVVDLLRQAGLTTTDYINTNDDDDDDDNNSNAKNELNASNKLEISSKESKSKSKSSSSSSSSIMKGTNRAYEYFDDTEIFGTAPSSVIDAADSAGASILAAMLGGKLRMLVDVRDAELSRDNDILVQFIELAILPVAAGLEGLTSGERNHRVKIVFPTVSQLLQYRKSMALSAPEVVALSTLGFDSVEESDNLVVVIAPRPDDEEGMQHLSELLNPSDPDDQLRQPIVVVNYHMIPLTYMNVDFEKVYHLRLLSVQYMSGDMNPQYVEKLNPIDTDSDTDTDKDTDTDTENEDKVTKTTNMIPESKDTNSTTSLNSSDEDAAFEAAMEHAHQIGVAQGITRAMVIRAFPR